MKYGFYRVACAAPRVTVADVSANCANIKSLVDEAASRGADAVVFPEMCVTGYTCADLFHSSRLLTGADAALGELAAHSASASGMLIAVGAARRGSEDVYPQLQRVLREALVCFFRIIVTVGEVCECGRTSGSSARMQAAGA